jgi:hypothetical protein
MSIVDFFGTGECVEDVMEDERGDLSRVVYLFGGLRARVGSTDKFSDSLIIKLSCLLEGARLILNFGLLLELPST